jgi:serine/threonine protein kinase
VRIEALISDDDTKYSSLSAYHLALLPNRTLAYMSPERLAGEEYDYSADIWGLGLCIVACALGRTPVGIAPDASCDAADEEVAPCDGSSSGYWNILQRIRKQQLPQLPAEFSLELRDFVRLCLDKVRCLRWRDAARSLAERSLATFLCVQEPTARPSAEELLQHPFVKGCSCSPTDQGGDCENDDGDDFADEQTSGNGSEHAFMEELHEVSSAEAA